MHLQGVPQAAKRRKFLPCSISSISVSGLCELCLQKMSSMNLFFKSTKPNEEEEEGALPQAFPSGQRPRALYIGRRC